MFGEVEAVDVGLEVCDVLRERDVVVLLKGKTVVRESRELLGAHQLGIVVGSISEGSTNLIFAVVAGVSTVRSLEVSKRTLRTT
jgi:hypothetical protein